MVDVWKERAARSLVKTRVFELTERTSENPRTGVSFMLGKLEATLGAEPPQVAAATAKAFKDLRMRERYARSSGLDAEFVGRTATSKQVTVTVKRCAPGQSVIFIQIGYFGDALLSTGLLEQIRANLTAAGVGRMGLPLEIIVILVSIPMIINRWC